ncbi:MAG: DUF4258 domain-containing protein [Candidatus Micrarchaeota archaeon]|nr:DUF4258 domain-containing protein [Candidatus Micrarchaeota archaeon]
MLRLEKVAGQLHAGELGTVFRSSVSITLDALTGLRRGRIRIALTHHAKDRMKQYGISKREIKAVLRKPMEQHSTDPKTVEYRRLMGNHVFGVAARPAKEDSGKYVIVTTFKDRKDRPYELYGSEIRSACR